MACQPWACCAPSMRPEDLVPDYPEQVPWDPGSSSPGASLRSPPLAPMAQEVLCSPEPPPWPCHTLEGDSGADQTPLLHWLAGSSEPNRTQSLFHLLLNLFYVPILVFSSSFNPSQNKVQYKQTDRQTDRPQQQ